MTITKGTALALLGMLAVSGAAQASASVNARQAYQSARIRQGVTSGELSRREAARLRAEQAALRAEEIFYRRDGVLGPRERAALARDQNRASRHIARQKHD